MNKLNKLGALVALLTITALFAGCSDQFLQDKKDYNAYNSDIYNDYTGATERVNSLYYDMLPSSTAGINWNTPSAGTSDDYSKCTEEYGGLSQYVDPSIVMDNTNVPDYFYYQNKNISPYGYIRECNMVIEGVKGGTLPADQKKTLLGQAYFFRAWQYYMLVKMYGGVPIVDHVQNPIIGSTGGLSLVIPRATSKACIDFICNDLDTASTYLPANWSATAATDNGRVTAGAALALQGRARLLYASPLFNRADDVARWETAYQSNKAAIAELTAGGFGLAYLSSPGHNASGWAKMFSDYTSPEAVFVTLYNTVQTSPGTNYDKNNTWENSIRPYNAGGSGGKNTTAQMIDLFPMADGRKPSTTSSVSSLLTPSAYAYDNLRFFVNRDPRFYRTFAFPGEKWSFSGDPTSLGANSYPYIGSNYVLWSYTWYDDATKRASAAYTGFAADGLGANNTSVFVRKRTDDLDVNNAPDYVYNTALGAGKAFTLSAAPYMEIRYAEVLLNFAESACGANHPDEAVAALQLIRQRVGYTSANNYGLDADLSSNRAKLFAAILYERQIELAYEGKRFDDMRRWMLFDGGVGQGSLNPNWVLTGFSGNTCTYLGVPPFNGTYRNGIEVRVADNISGTNATTISTATTVAGFANDPLVKNSVVRPTPLNLMSDSTVQITGNTIDKLFTFYANNLTRKYYTVDAAAVTFQPKYYFIGLRYSAQQMNVTLKQTIGWPDLENGNANGTYDPLAE
ncbi:MAG: RagB/SusD family nutrient uptake outer membrane protein [Paludibacter sp.]|nr:RagB/SusD family nutrient uptake outer membrane protein [Paludibacter sp.]